MRKYMNEAPVSLSMAVWLATDDYDYDETTISATALIKPVRQIVLGSRVPAGESLSDVMGMVPSRMGTAIHDSIERAWKDNYQTALKDLGYPAKVIERVRINPDPEDVGLNDIPVYMEKREYRQIMGYTISGKFDFLAEGRLEDFKSTSVNAWIMGNKDETYRLQGSIYRWLNPKIVTQDSMAIQFIFTDFQPMRAKIEPGYPNHRVEEHRIPLLSLDQTEQYITSKLTEVNRYWDAEESEIPYCSDADLWRKDPEYKYYKNPEKTSRSTKNYKVSDFGSAQAAEQAAYQRKSQDGNVGKVVTIPGKVMACKYCAAFPICSQKDQLIADGSLDI